METDSLDAYQNAEKINTKVTVVYQERTETLSLRIYLDNGKLFLEIETLDEIELTRGLQCWLDKSTGNFRLQHNDEFSDLPSTVVFQFNPGFEPEKIRFEQLMLKYATFHEYHSRPSFSDEPTIPNSNTLPMDGDEHIYEDLDEYRLNLNLKEVFGSKFTIEKDKIMKKMAPLLGRIKGTDRKRSNSPQSLSRSSSCSSQPTPPGGIYDGPTNISTELKPELLVNPGYVDPTGNIKIYQTDGYSPESFRRANMIDQAVSPHRIANRRPTRKPPAPPSNVKPYNRKSTGSISEDRIPENRKSTGSISEKMKEDIYNAAYFINKTRNKTPPPPPSAPKPPLIQPIINVSPVKPLPRQKFETEVIDRAKVESREINTLKDKLKMFESFNGSKGNVEKKSFTKTENSEIKTPKNEIRLPKGAIKQTIGRQPNQVTAIADRIKQPSKSSTEIVEKSKPNESLTVKERMAQLNKIGLR